MYRAKVQGIEGRHTMVQGSESLKETSSVLSTFADSVFCVFHHFPFLKSMTICQQSSGGSLCMRLENSVLETVSQESESSRTWRIFFGGGHISDAQGFLVLHPRITLVVSGDHMDC